MELIGFESECVELLEKAPNKHSRNCFRSAINHLTASEKLISIDSEMAIFRAITAEEEAASGLMHCLKECGYINADSLNPQSHPQKNAVIPFIRILQLFYNALLKSMNIKPFFHIKDVDNIRRLTLAYPIFVNEIEYWSYPVPPLNFKISLNDENPSYKEQISEYMDAKNIKDMRSYIRKEANIRNTILYAGPSGYPKVESVSPKLFENKKIHIFMLLKAYLLIYPYDNKQPFVQDALDVFVSIFKLQKK